MAVKTYTVTDISFAGTRSTIVAWAAMVSGDTGTPFDDPGGGDRSVQIEGAFGDGTLTFQGSNNSTEYHPLTDPQGNDIAKTAADLEAITETARYMRPSMSGTSASGILVTMLVRRQ